jgi:4'-phosphopantetheinyl transferase
MSFPKRSTPLYLPFFEEAQFRLVNLQQIQDEEVEEAKKLLDQEGITYTERFKAEEDRKRALLFHAEVRRLLGEALHRPPQELTIIRPQRGRPYLRDFPLHFNLSHTKQFGLIGVHPRSPLGVDIEGIKNDQAVLEMTKRHFHPSEKKRIEAAPNPVDLFYSFWCAREALLKALGTGFLVDDLPELSLVNESEGIELFTCGGREIRVYAGIVKSYKLAVCVLN